ncbi:hypothetical protein CI109_104322 [Kwoniella shandongensis]|uniref:Uncharacterized protein n=1 Tax=Kwoniella shandongensis TaxID=1734106 RepID=A0A5M6BXA0_9TREE|nr:uncharacterized protein CI109_004282 [Kwoniella shandongensis]KAA5527464.1 hypothetical protein CI109_004282 [Kwoniella shandongensis]
MTTLERPPLGSSTAANIFSREHKYPHPIKPSSKHHAGHKLKPALDDASEPSRKTAKADGMAEARERDVRSTRNETEELKRDLERAKAKLARRDETIRTLSESRSKHEADDGVEQKLGELVKRHSATKAKYEAQVNELRSETSQLQEQLANVESAHTKDTSTISDLRRANLLAETENNNLKRELESLRHSRTHDAAAAGSSRHVIRDLENEKIKYTAEKHKLEREVKRLSSLVEENETEAKISREELETTIEGNKRLQETMEKVTITYAVLYRNTVSKQKYTDLQERHLVANDAAREWKTRAEVLESKVLCKKEEIKNLKEKIRSIDRTSRMMERNIEDVREDRRRLVDEISTFMASRPSMDAVKPLEQAFDHKAVLKHTIVHADLISKFYRQQLSALQTEHSDLLTAHTKIVDNLASVQSTLTASQRSHAELQSRFAAFEDAHAPCGGAIADLRQALGKSILNEEDRARDIAELKKELKAVEGKAQREREALKRANDLVTRGKMAEDALDEEIQQLREAYLSAAKYEALYNDLYEQQAIVLSREAAAIDEAERLGMQNAELMGHGNEGQKISYVEGVRREMAAVKQELAATRHMLNTANSKIQTLESEIDSYKSIGSTYGLDPNLGGSTRTRVVRRQPEGGRLIQSTRGGRSVSGPVGR